MGISPLPTTAAFSLTSCTLFWLPLLLCHVSPHHPASLDSIPNKLLPPTPCLRIYFWGNQPRKEVKLTTPELSDKFYIITSGTTRHCMLPDSMKQGVCMKYSCQNNYNYNYKGGGGEGAGEEEEEKRRRKKYFLKTYHLNTSNLADLTTRQRNKLINTTRMQIAK